MINITESDNLNYIVKIQSPRNGDERPIKKFKSYEDAENFCDELGWELLDNNNNLWGLVIKEKDYFDYWGEKF